MERVKVCQKLSFKIMDFEVDKMPKNVPGVWMLLGRNNINEKWECLQVGVNKNIYKEISTDIFYMDKLIRIKKPYINQFGEIQFWTKGEPSVQNKLYFTIRNEYDQLAFIVVCENIEDAIERKLIEKYVAYRTRAKYWRNGRPYKAAKEVSNEDLFIDISLIDKYLHDIDSFLNENVLTKGMRERRI